MIEGYSSPAKISMLIFTYAPNFPFKFSGNYCACVKIDVEIFCKHCKLQSILGVQFLPLTVTMLCRLVSVTYQLPFDLCNMHIKQGAWVRAVDLVMVTA